MDTTKIHRDRLAEIPFIILSNGLAVFRSGKQSEFRLMRKMGVLKYLHTSNLLVFSA